VLEDPLVEVAELDARLEPQFLAQMGVERPVGVERF
jgi:hypothetical protein